MLIVSYLLVQMNQLCVLLLCICDEFLCGIQCNLASVFESLNGLKWNAKHQSE